MRARASDRATELEPRRAGSERLDHLGALVAAVVLIIAVINAML